MDLIRHLRYFVAVAEHRQFGRAADELGVTQPPVSQGVRRLERTLGVTLFARTPGGVVLTSDGASLLPRARLLLDDSARLLEEAARLSGPPQRLRIGILGALHDALLSACVSGVRQAMSDAAAPFPVLATTAGTTDLLARVACGDLDVAVVEHPTLLDGVTAGPVLRIRRWVLVPQGHRAAEAASPRAGMLGDLAFATGPRQDNPPGHDLLLDGIRSHGLDPEVVAAPLPRDVLSAVSSGSCFGLTTAPPPDPTGVSRVRVMAAQADLRVRVVTADAQRFRRPVDVLDRILRAGAR